jgi:hypothetical protein
VEGIIRLFKDEHLCSAKAGILVTSFAIVIFGRLLQQLYRDSIALVHTKTESNVEGAVVGVFDDGAVVGGNDGLADDLDGA